MARASTISAVCIDLDGNELSGPEYGICVDHSHNHKPNPQWLITEDGYDFKVGDRLFNYYDGEWGTVVSEPREWDGWFDFQPEGVTWSKTLNSVRVSKKQPSWSKT